MRGRRRRQINRRSLGTGRRRRFDSMRFWPRRRSSIQRLGTNANLRSRLRRWCLRYGTHIRRQIHNAKLLARREGFFRSGNVGWKDLWEKNQKNDEAYVKRDRKRSGEKVFLRVALFFRLDQQVCFAGIENIRLDQFAQLSRHLLRFVEPVNLALFRWFYIGGYHHARIEDIERRIFGNRAETLELLGRHRAGDQRAIN